MKNRLFFIIALVSCICCLSVTAYPWGKDGHHIISIIADSYLTTEARTGISDLLGNETLLEIDTWADSVKRDPQYEWSRPLHYLNPVKSMDEFVLERDCPPQGCVVSAIVKYRAVLQDKETTREQKAEALKFLVHFIGDIHQPLHVSRAEDFGGNNIRVEFFHNVMNLHSVWDTAIIKRTKKYWYDYGQEITSGITPENIREWQNDDPILWAKESYQISLEYAYKIPKTMQLDQEYFEHNLPIIEKRLAQAGVRTAYILNAIFADFHPCPPPTTPIPCTPAEKAPAGAKSAGWAIWE